MKLVGHLVSIETHVDPATREPKASIVVQFEDSRQTFAIPPERALELVKPFRAARPCRVTLSIEAGE